MKSEDTIFSINKFIEKVQFLRSELTAGDALNENSRIPIAEEITKKYLSNLSRYLNSFEKSAKMLESYKHEIIDKIAKLNAQFNEDPTTDSCIIFYALNQLLLSTTKEHS